VITRASAESPQVLVLSGATRAVLGEGPVWDERQQRLYWVDIERGELHQCREDGSEPRYVQLPGRLGCVVLRRDRPGLVAGLEREIVALTLEPLHIERLAALDAQEPYVRCNDGKCDLEGRFWVGTCDARSSEAVGWLYRYTVAGEPVRTLGPCVCVNGPAFSPDGRRLYWVDSYQRVIHAAALDVAGKISRPRIFTRFEDPTWGYPDGLTCDAEGCVWVAHWGGARISRFSPHGELLAAIALPVKQPSSCTFGGAGLRRLFISSAAIGLSSSGTAPAVDGALLAVDLPVGGLPAGRYAG